MTNNIKTIRDLEKSPDIFSLETSKDFINNYYHHYFGISLIQEVYENKKLSNYKDAYVEALVELLDEKLYPHNNVKYEIIKTNIKPVEFELEIGNKKILLNKDTVFLKFYDKNNDYFVSQIELHYDNDGLEDFHDTFYTKEEWLDYKKENGEKYQIKDNNSNNNDIISCYIDEKVNSKENISKKYQ